MKILPPLRINKKPEIKAIIFDAEGVVVNTEPLWDKSQRILLSKYGVQYDRNILKPLMAGRNMQEGSSIMIEYYGLDISPENLAEERWTIIRKLFMEEIKFIDGFRTFYAGVKLYNVKTAIATDMNRSLMDLVDERLALRQIFDDHIYHIEDVGNRSKPDPSVFLLAADSLKIEPAHCMVIEDSPNGIIAANAAGMLSVGITTTFDQQVLHEAALIVENFKEISTSLKLFK